MKNLKMVEVIWWDIAESDNRWQTLTKLEKFLTDKDANVVKQLGYLWEEDEHQVVIISSYFPQGGLYGTCTVIPRGCILKMTKLEAKENKDVLLLEQTS